MLSVTHRWATLGPISPSSLMNSDLSVALRLATRDGKFDASQFFNCWFDEHGSACYFLFRKNLAITNIQFAELLALIRTYTTDCQTGRRKEHILFLSAHHLKDTIADIVTERGSLDATDDRLAFVTSTYAELLERIVVVDPFYGSAAVFLPPNLSIDLATICALSGYIHSCGRNVLLRSTEKLTKPLLTTALQRHLDRFPPSGGPLFLAAYAHEDFSSYDRRVAARLKDGLDDVKIHLEKFFIGDERLPTVLRTLSEDFAGRLLVPKPGDYHQFHVELRKKDTLDRSRTLWLVVDSSVTPDGRRGEERFFVCYDQMYCSECPFQLFDENKPAWIAHTTIPHSLMRAMLNVTLPWHEGRNQIADPFSGTGTTWLECLKFVEADTTCSDLDPVAKLVAEDNLDFFAFPIDRLEHLSQELQRVAEVEDIPENLELFPDAQNRVLPETLDRAVALLGRFVSKESDRTTESGTLQFAAELKKEDFLVRLLLYVGLRAELRYSGAFSRESMDRRASFALEARALSEQIHDLVKWRRAADRRINRIGNFRLFEGDYSQSLGIDPRVLEKMAKEDAAARTIMVRDCRDLPPGKYDIVVADPPYGFNTNEEQESLANLYREAILKLVDSLAEDGQLVLCLPDRSRIGRFLPVCTRKELVIHQVLLAADKLGKEVVNPAIALPAPGPAFFRPPYYWESEKALRRAVLHFRIRRKPA